jgi:hypothetical protein
MPSENAQLLRVRVELEALISERDGMIAENTMRTRNGERLAYGEGNFFQNAEKIRALLQMP